MSNIETLINRKSAWSVISCGRGGQGSSKPENLSDSDENEAEESLSATQYISSGFTPSSGGPFSALTPSMWPADILQQIETFENGKADSGNYYDEFGFRLDDDDDGEAFSSRFLGEPFIEDSQHRLKWIAYLEFRHNQSGEFGDLTWNKIEVRLTRTDKLQDMIAEKGIPHSLRPRIWMRLSGALDKKNKSNMRYKELVRESSNDRLVVNNQIEKDLLRTLPSNACFSKVNAAGVPRLRRVLRSLAWLYPDIGYCQGMGVVAATLLLFYDEENAFWSMAALIEDLLPASYYSTSLLGIQADQRVLRQLVALMLPTVDAALTRHDIELSLVCLQWFLTVFASVVHVRVLLRIWDLFFYHGSVVLFQIALALLKLKEKEIADADSAAVMFNILSNIPAEIHDVEQLLKLAQEIAGSLTYEIIEGHRKKCLARLMAENGLLVNPDRADSLPKQNVTRRHLPKSQSMLASLLSTPAGLSAVAGRHGGNTRLLTVPRRRGQSATVLPEEADALPVDDLRVKNVKQTELLIDLRDAIMQIGRHFQQLEPRRFGNSVQLLQADYSVESHTNDLERYVSIAKTRRRRAKALLDFEKHDPDELGFARNDIVSIINMSDEHCWVGELGGQRGWFPAKFVELLDERTQLYSSAGDDSVTDGIADLVRGTLCPVLKALLEHGIKRSSLLAGRTVHPWLFVEEVARHEIQRDFDSVYSRLVLCKTFRLDEDGKVLTPEELLYRSVQSVNMSHDVVSHAQMDMKFRSLICLGLNEQVLHLWFEVLCSCADVVEKWYYPWSFVRSPGWVQIKCELRILGQFPFHLQKDWELPKQTQGGSVALKEGVRDMLIKHHLFNWSIGNTS